MVITFIRRVLNALSNREKEENKEEPKDRIQTTAKIKKCRKAETKAGLKEKEGLKKENKNQRVATKTKNVTEETSLETEDQIRSCAADIKHCIDLINNSSTSNLDEPVGSRGRAKVKNKKTNRSADNRKASNSKRCHKSIKKSKQEISPAEMIVLLDKAEKKLSKAVVRAKEKEDKNRGNKNNVD